MSLSGGGFYTEICACGHAVSRHTLVGTEYCRCENYPGECPCSGGARVALLVEENVERPSGTVTNARFFRRQFDARGEHPLNAGLKKISALEDSSVSVEWAVTECDICGQDDCGDLVAYWVDSHGGILFEVTEMTGRTLLVCNGCVLDWMWEHNGFS